MVASQNDVIVAIATAQGRGGIGVVRLSGRELSPFINAILHKPLSPRVATYLDFKDAKGSPLDRGIAIHFPAPNSYTGEHVLELQGHGSPAVQQMILQRCLEIGARLAEPGEFTRRAWLNDKMDLAQAEAVADLIEASSVQAAQSALRSLSGEFSSHIHQLRDKLVDIRLFIEASLDFPEEDIDFITQGRVEQQLNAIQHELSDVLKKSQQGRVLRDGIQVVLIGQPNVGKSTLLNRLVGEELAIVTPLPGTTRDTLRSEIHINGIPIHIVDTAGLRETTDEIEQIGIARTWQATEKAQVALILVDSVTGITDYETRILEKLASVPHRLWIHNKIDKTEQQPEIVEKNGETHLFLSAKSGAGVDNLRQMMLKIAGWQSGAEGVFMARTRHLDVMKRVSKCLYEAKRRLKEPELLAEELRLMQKSLNEITGEFTSDDLLGEIFGRFCIGK